MEKCTCFSRGSFPACGALGGDLGVDLSRRIFIKTKVVEQIGPQSKRGVDGENGSPFQAARPAERQTRFIGKAARKSCGDRLLGQLVPRLFERN